MGCIYFLKSLRSGLVKIGYTESFDRRLSQLRNANADQLDVLGVLSGSLEQEHDLHADAEPYRDHAEWYSDCEEIRDLIERTLKETNSI